MGRHHRFTSFADLYRAAYAEPDPRTKQLLLAEVKKALDRWAEASPEGIASSGKPVASEGDPKSLPTVRYAA